jgi:hypothetical protein
MPSARLAAASIVVLILAPAMARADDVCARLTGAVAMAANGFDLAEGDPITSDSGQYWHSKIQFSDGDNCAIEAHKLLTCSWEPSTEADLKKMTDSVAACFPDAHPDVVKPDDDPDGPPGARFTIDQASIEIGLTADVLSLNIGPKSAPETPQTAPAAIPGAASPSSPDTAPQPTPPDTGPTSAASPPAATAIATPQPTPPDTAPTPAPPTPLPAPAPAAPDVAPPSSPDATPQPEPDKGPTPTPTPQT